MAETRPPVLLLLLLLLAAAIRPARCSAAASDMVLQRAGWTAGGQLLDELVSARFASAGECQCRLACLARPDCLSVSVARRDDGRVDCALSEHRGHPTLIQPGTEHTAVLLERPGRSRRLDWCHAHSDCVTVGAGCFDFQCVCAAGLTPDGQQCQCGETYGQPGSGPCQFRDCAELRRAGATADGTYTLILQPGFAVRADCDMSTDGGGWTLIQRRTSLAQADIFTRKDWEGYAKLFRTASGNYWLGNRLVYMLTSAEPQTLRVDLESGAGETAHAEYGSFDLSDEASSFQLTVGEFRDGGAGDALSAQSGHKFVTLDRHTSGLLFMCHERNDVGWWMSSFCWRGTNLNGRYQQDHWLFGGAVWKTWQDGASLEKTKMMVRPQSFQ